MFKVPEEVLKECKKLLVDYSNEIYIGNSKEFLSNKKKLKIVEKQIKLLEDNYGV